MTNKYFVSTLDIIGKQQTSKQIYDKYYTQETTELITVITSKSVSMILMILITKYLPKTELQQTFADSASDPPLIC